MNVVLSYLEQHRERLNLARLGISMPLTALVLTPRFQASRHVVFLLFSKGGRVPALVAKIPRLTDGHPSLTREAASLGAVQSLRPSGFDSVPRLIAFELHAGRPMLIETALTGSPMDPAVVRERPDHCCQLIADWLIDLQTASAHPAGADWFTAIIEQPLRQFSETFPLTPDDRLLVDRTLALAEPLRSAGLPFVCEHGDLSHPNVFLQGPDSVGVVDWELAHMNGLVAYDLFVFLTYVAFSRSSARTVDEQVAAVRAAFFTPDGWGVTAARNYAERAGIPSTLLGALFVVCWARYTATLFSRLIEEAASSDDVSADTAAWLRGNRYFQLWQDAVVSSSRLGWNT
ncbi:MAG: aminoglycoside phosphotransferase family protein [Vicinamibacterales bacterium]